jgi:hypothetical protein
MRLEGDVRDIKDVLVRLEPMIIRIDAQLPQFATKAELANLRTELLTALADKPGKVFLATAIGVLLAAYALGLAGLAALPVVARLVQ